MAKAGAVCVVQGYASRLFVERGVLVVRDGIGRAPRERVFGRATHGLTRLVLLGSSGTLSLAALTWLADVGIAFVHLALDGRVLATSAGLGLDDPRLRRAQALAWGTPTGLGIARDLLRQKLDGQARVARELPDGEAVAATIQKLSTVLGDAASVEALMVVEAAAAASYWAAWADIPIPWVRADAIKVPGHWRTVGGRASPLTGNPRLAVTPGQAIRNLLLAIAQAEARLACLAVGLDPGLGVLHADLRARDSLVLDVLEAARADVDAYVLELLRRQVFRASDFHETRKGVCRVLPPLSHRLAGTAPIWRHRLGPVVERVARQFAAGPDSRVDRLPTKLTEANRSAGRAATRRRSSTLARQSVRLRLAVCRECGSELADAGRRYCDACLPTATAGQMVAFLGAARTAKAEQRAAGHDPSHGGAAAGRRGQTQRAHARTRAQWNREHEAQPSEVFRRDVLPGLARVSLRRLAEATGLSVGYCARIKRGEAIPHPMWWDLAAAVPGAPASYSPETQGAEGQ